MTGRRILALLAGLALIAGVLALVARPGEAERMVTTDSDEAYEYYQQGVAARQRFDLEAARKAFQAAIAADSTFAMAHLRLGESNFVLQRGDAGREHIDDAFALRDRVTEIERLWIERNHAAIHGKPAEAKALTDEMAAKYPDHPWVLRLLGDLARLDGRFDDAVDAFSRALELDPEAVELHNLLGYALLEQGSYEEAVQSLQRYAFYAPDQANPHDSLGEAYFYTGRFEEATKEFLRALEIDPAFGWAGVHLADVLSVTGQIERAHRVLDEMEPLFEERAWQPWMRLTRMNIDIRAQRWEALEKRADTVIAESGDEANDYLLFAHFARALALLEQGRVEAARGSLLRLDELSDTLLAKAGDFQRVRDSARLHEAMIVSRLARAEGAPLRNVEELSAAIESSSLSPHELAFHRYELANAYFDGGEYEQAAAAADAALERIPTLPSLNLIAARAKAELGERDPALAHLKTYLEVMRFADADHPRVEIARRLLQRLLPRS